MKPEDRIPRSDAGGVPPFASSSAVRRTHSTASPLGIRSELCSPWLARREAERFGDLALDFIEDGLDDWAYGAARTAARFAKALVKERAAARPEALLGLALLALSAACVTALVWAVGVERLLAFAFAALGAAALVISLAELSDREM